MRFCYPLQPYPLLLDERALFKFDSADLMQQGEAQWQEFLAELERYANVNDISVIGYTDSVGSDTHNLQLSELRTITIGARLALVYPDAQITLAGRGETNPIASNDVSAGRQSNRRVEIEMTASESTLE